ncbi:MAG: sensor histidine kinase [Bdellovibrionia bacterium]
MSILLNVIVYNQMISALEQDFDNALFNYAIDVSKSVEIDRRGDVDFPPLRVDDGKILPFPLGNALIQIRHRSGRVLTRVGAFGSFNPPYKESMAFFAKKIPSHYTTIDRSVTQNIPDAPNIDYRLITLPLDNEIKPRYLLQIAVPMTLLEKQISSRLRLVQFGIPTVLIIAAIGGLFLSGRALAPLAHMIRNVDQMNAQNLSERLEMPLANDEIKKLTTTLNNLFSRIENAFRSQEQFVADASHQLLTPISIARGEIEKALKNVPQDQKQSLSSALQEIDHLSSIIQKMLLLAKVDAGISALNLETISFDDVIEKSISRCEKLAQQKEINIKFDMQLKENDNMPTVNGDQDLLNHMLSNLIENAIKYSPEKTQVIITLDATKKSPQIIVEDQGPGLNDNELESLFSRFKRGSKAETLSKGHGLGLAIAKRIAEIHNGTLSAENKTQSHGAKFIFTLNA